MRIQIVAKLIGALSLFLFSCRDDPPSGSTGKSDQPDSPEVVPETPPVAKALPSVAGNSSLEGATQAEADSPEVVAEAPPVRDALPPDAIEEAGQALPPGGGTQARIQAVLRKANPDYRGQGRFHEQDGEIVAAEFPNCSLRDLSPFKGLKLQMLDLSGNPVREIRHLQGMPLNVLWLENTEVVSLKSLSNANLRELRLNNSPVESLDGIQGQPLENLYAVGTRIKGIEPLRKSNLRGLWLTGSPVSDLSPLAGLPLESLTAHRTLVNDLSFVRKLPVIQRLHIGETLIEDLTPLEGLRLTRLVFTPARIKRGIEAAQRLQGLREIGVAFDDQRQELMPPGQFWAQYKK
jgi:internalin A